MNSRTKNELNFIPEIDGSLILPRTNPDVIKNTHGDFFLQFLKDSRALICNGRVTPDYNDFTFLSTRGRSVPDYIYCPAEQISFCKSMKVLKVSDIVNEYRLDVPGSLPDHSMLVGSFDISTNEEYCIYPDSVPKRNQSLPSNRPPTKIKKNIKKMDDTFFLSEEITQQVNNTITRIELIMINQNTLNEIYTEIKSIFLAEMSRLPDIPVSCNKKARRQKRKSQPFWNDELNGLWVIRCEKEKLFSEFICKSREDILQKQILRKLFQQSQQHFDKKFRFFKRQHKSKNFKDLENMATNDPNEMWKRFKSLSEPKSSKVILEIIRNDKSISTDIKEILTRWHSDISGLFSGVRENPELAYDDRFSSKSMTLKLSLKLCQVNTNKNSL